MRSSKKERVAPGEGGDHPAEVDKTRQKPDRPARGRYHRLVVVLARGLPGRKLLSISQTNRELLHKKSGVAEFHMLAPMGFYHKIITSNPLIHQYMVNIPQIHPKLQILYYQPPKKVAW